MIFAQRPKKLPPCFFPSFFQPFLILRKRRLHIPPLQKGMLIISVKARSHQDYQHGFPHPAAFHTAPASPYFSFLRPDQHPPDKDHSLFLIGIRIGMYSVGFRASHGKACPPRTLAGQKNPLLFITNRHRQLTLCRHPERELLLPFHMVKNAVRWMAGKGGMRTGRTVIFINGGDNPLFQIQRSFVVRNLSFALKLYFQPAGRQIHLYILRFSKLRLKNVHCAFTVSSFCLLLRLTVGSIGKPPVISYREAAP